MWRQRKWTFQLTLALGPVRLPSRPWSSSSCSSRSSCSSAGSKLYIGMSWCLSFSNLHERRWTPIKVPTGCTQLSSNSETVIPYFVRVLICTTWREYTVGLNYMAFYTRLWPPSARQPLGDTVFKMIKILRLQQIKSLRAYRFRFRIYSIYRTGKYSSDRKIMLLVEYTKMYTWRHDGIIHSSLFRENWLEPVCKGPGVCLCDLVASGIVCTFQPTE